MSIEHTYSIKPPSGFCQAAVFAVKDAVVYWDQNTQFHYLYDLELLV